MHYVRIPADIQLIDPMSRKPIPAENGGIKAFTDHALRNWIDDKRMGTTPKELRRTGKLADALEALEPGAVWAVEDADYERLKQVVENPDQTSGYASNNINRQLVGFSEAFLDATTEKPVEQVTNGRAVETHTEAS